jgi:soluble lytic murein transglycosylase-like protein
MQVDPKAWELNASKLKSDEEYNVKNASKILKLLHDKYDGSKEKAIKAYNIGMGSIARGIRSDAGDRYWAKFKEEFKKLTS